MRVELDSQDKSESRKTLLLLAVLALVLIVGGALLLPELNGLIETHLSPGVGVKDAAVISFFLTLILLVIFAFSAGDGLIGELQFMLSGFFIFFAIIWMMVAWVF